MTDYLCYRRGKGIEERLALLGLCWKMVDRANRLHTMRQEVTGGLI